MSFVAHRIRELHTIYYFDVDLTIDNRLTGM